MTALLRYDAARRALAAAHRIDEAKDIRDKAEAVRTYAKLAGDFELQNQAAEIRIRAERRAGQLLLEMEKNVGTRGTGRPRKDGSRNTRSTRFTAYPPKLEEVGISKDQSSKWQRLALLLDEATFDKALAQAREKRGELTTASLLRQIKEMVRPSEVFTVPDVNVSAAELARELESAHRREKLEQVFLLRKHLNPTIRKRLILALQSSLSVGKHLAEQLARDFEDYPAKGKAFQRVIRERMAQHPDPLLSEKLALAKDFRSASVREISLLDARNLIVAQEWLGTLGSSEHAFGLFFGEHLAGCICFGSTAGTMVRSSVCGAEHANKVTILTRGCCLHWAHPHSGSFLVSAACREMTKKGYHVFVAYADPEAGERGTILRACNFLYCGATSPAERFRTPQGRIHDARQVHCLIRDRTGGTMRYRRSRAEQKQLLLANGCDFFRAVPKYRFVGIFGDRRIKRRLRNALRWEVEEFPREYLLSSRSGSGVDLPQVSAAPAVF